MKSCVILISGRGSNMQAILRAGVPMTIAAVLSNEPRAAGLELARAAGIPTQSIDHREFASRDEFDARLSRAIDSHRAELIVLAGFMRILGGVFVHRYSGRIVNIHPSLLPSFPGLHTHRRALQAGVRIHGCTVHYVTPELDHGPIIIQAAVPVLPGDDEDRLAVRVLAEEHRIYPQALTWIAQGKVRLDDGGRVSYPHDRAGNALVAPPVDA